MRVAPHIVYNFFQQGTAAKCFGDMVLLISYIWLHIYLFRMSPKRVGGADDGARGNKCKHKSLSMLEKMELLKKYEKGPFV